MKTPSLLIKPSAYKSNKLYAVVPDNGNGDLSVAGTGSSKTRINERGLIQTVSSGLPRVDWGAGKPSLLIEPTRTNYVPDSSDLSVFTMSEATSSILSFNADSGVAPDGTYTAYLFEDKKTTGSITQYVDESYTLNDNTSKQVFSIFLKHISCSVISVGISTGATSGRATGAFFISSDGVATEKAGAQNIESYSVDKYTDGWYRFNVVFTPESGVNTIVNVNIGVEDIDSGGEIYSGSFLMWGAQLEEGEFVTSYIPTSGSAVTRNTDEYILSNIVANDIISNSSGAIMFDFYYGGETPELNDTEQMSIGLSGSTIGISTFTSSSFFRALIDNDSDTSVNLSTGRNRVLFNMDNDTIDIWVNGTMQGTNNITAAGIIENVIRITGSSVPYRIYEIAAYLSPLNSDEAKKITQ